MNIIESNLTFKSSLTKRPMTNMLVLHHAEASTCSVQDIHNWHLQNGWSGFGYHFLVRKDGSIYRGRPIDTVGAHVYGFNETSIGICAEGNYMKETMPKAQKDAIIDLIRYLKKTYIASKIVGHKELMSTACPGTNYPLEEIKKESIVQKHWAQDAFDKLNANGIMIKETRFDDKISRAEVFILLAQLLDRRDN